MSDDIVFECPKCRQWLEAPANMTGLFVECPKCDAIIKVPLPGASPDPAREPRQEPEPESTPKVDDEALKGSTIRIDLPPGLGIPAPPKRRVTIRRKT